MFYDREIAAMFGEKKFGAKECKHCGSHERYTSNGNCVECQLRRNKSWSSRNRERHLQLLREWHKKNYVPKPKPLPERTTVDKYHIRQKWIKENPEKYKGSILKTQEKLKEKAPFKLHVRRTRQIRNNADMTKKELRQSRDKILSLKHLGCSYCGSHERLNIDHIIPVARGGSNHFTNLQWLCRHHNAQKWARTDEEYRAWCAERNIPLFPIAIQHFVE